MENYVSYIFSLQEDKNVKNLMRYAALVLSLALVVTMFAGATIKTDLPVVDSEAFTENQQSAAALLMPLGILAGTGDGELGTGTVTRAQMTAFLYRLVNGGDTGVEKYAKSKRLYSDVDTQEWYAPYINWAYDTKTAYGYTDGRFGPNDPITGAQAAAMLVRLLGRDASGEDYALKAQTAALELGLDKGIETKGLYENALSRGDMFILLSRALTVRVKGVSIAEKNFDLEIVSGAILLGVDHIDRVNNRNEYEIFSFRTETSGDVKDFAADLLCIAGEDAEVAEDFGCKFTLLVTKQQDVQGYRHLYAAYEEEQGPYYKIFAGTVDDGKAVFAKDATASRKQNVFYDENCLFYVAGRLATKLEFEASFGRANKARYKLIDNDGDGYYEYAIVDRLTLARMDLQFVTAKVVAVADDYAITLEGKDGTVYKDLVCGEFYLEENELKASLSAQETVFQALGIRAQGYMPYTAISDVWYRFGISGGYLFTVSATSDTNFHGSYGVLVAWANPMNFYKNMPYGQFVNEDNEYFWAYVDKLDEAKSARKWATTPENSLIYFTDADYSDDVVSFDTAGFFNSNYTYRELMASDIAVDRSTSQELTINFEDAVITGIYPKETYDYSKRAKFGYTYAVFDSNPAALKYWDASSQQYVPVPAATQIQKSDNRTLAVNGNPLPLMEYADVEGRYLVQIGDSAQFYGIEDLEACLGFVYVTDAEITVSVGTLSEKITSSEYQIYRQNGFWHIRTYADIDPIEKSDLGVTWGDYNLVQRSDGNWYVLLVDGNDPEADIDYFRVAELLKGFNDAVFSDRVDEIEDELVTTGFENELIYYDWGLNISAGVVFAYGSVLNIDNTDFCRWVAFDASTFDADFGYGAVASNIIPSGNTADELIYTRLGGNMYVKALKISDNGAKNLPFGWLVAKGFELLVYGGKIDGVSVKGTGIRALFLSESSIKANTLYTKIDLEHLRIQIGDNITEYEVKSGDVLMVRVNSDGVIEEAYPVGRDYRDYLIYARGLQDAIDSLTDGD